MEIDSLPLVLRDRLLRAAVRRSRTSARRQDCWQKRMPRFTLRAPKCTMNVPTGIRRAGSDAKAFPVHPRVPP